MSIVDSSGYDLDYSRVTSIYIFTDCRKFNVFTPSKIKTFPNYIFKHLEYNILLTFFLFAISEKQKKITNG